MACEYYIDTENGLIRADYSGLIDRQALQECIKKLFNNPAFNSGFDGVSDFRKANLEMNYDELEKFRAWLDQQETNSTGRWAVLVSTDLGYGTIRVWEVLSEGYHESLRVFRKEDEALSWLMEKQNNSAQTTNSTSNIEQ